MEKKQFNNSLTFDCFCVVLLDLLSNVDNVRCVYEMKHLEERFAILFYDLLPERTVDLKELWEITVLKKKSAKASEVLGILKSFVDLFAENPLKVGNPMKAVTYYVAYALLCLYFNTIIDDEVEDFGVE